MFFDEAPVGDSGQHCASSYDAVYRKIQERTGDSLALDLRQYQPAVVPAAYARGVADDLPFGFIKTF